MPPTSLVLFDIDGTLLSAGRASREALLEAFERNGAPGMIFDGYDFSGKTDPQIVRELLAGRGEEAGTERVARVIDVYLEALERRIGPGAVVAKRGAAELLAVLASRNDVTLALLTGNHERGARAKLEPVGFNPYFPFGAFGSDHADRYALPAIAVARARERTGRDFRGKQVVVIGDSIHDVACGRAAGVKSVAVASGLTRPERLARENPDHLFPDFADVPAVAEAILG
ncbi:MAG TPA: HAD family hydrolase [Thermoanaerobaculia bacterium]|nr:HAD family hydrolase [Thermoanaerobaculia bacterium]